VDDSAVTAERPWLATDRRPRGVSDETVAAVGKASEAMEWIERARGRLYDFHQMLGRADLLFGDAAAQLQDAGHGELAEQLRREIVGRNVLEGRWTFQIIEEFDATYYDACRDAVRRLDHELVGGTRHVYESEMKEQRRSPGRRHHEQRPVPGA
jgi:hypothetical protein